MCALNESSAVPGAALQGWDPWIQCRARCRKKGLEELDNVLQHIHSILMPFQAFKSISARRALESIREVKRKVLKLKAA